MDILRNLFGHLTSGLIRLAVTGGILVLCYLLIVKPVLKETHEAIHSTGLDRIDETIDSVNRGVRRQIRHSFKVTKARGGNTSRLVECVQRADGNVAKIERCTRRF